MTSSDWIVIVPFALLFLMGLFHQYLRILLRNYEMKKLASELGLRFEDHLPGFRKIFLKIGEYKINSLTGSIGNRQINIFDTIKVHAYNFWPPRKKTNIEIDGKLVVREAGHESIEYYWLREGDIRKALRES